jgi:hypothetical protein
MLEPKNWAKGNKHFHIRFPPLKKGEGQGGFYLYSIDF